MSVRLLAVAASLRQVSLNRRLLRVAVDAARRGGATVDVAEFHEFDMPLFNGDVQERDGFPPGARELARRLEAVDGLLLASPEYNFSLPGTLKNAIDWVSRMRPVPLRGKSAFLLAASNGAIGGIRGLWQLRIPLEGLGVFVYPDMFTLPRGGEAFTEEGGLKDGPTQERLETLLRGYLRAAAALAAPVS
jgi:NAD(P)H-dependent FMN reductase